MKYPNVIFYRYDKYEDIDSYFELNKDKLECTINITNNKDYLNNLFNPNFHILVTYGVTWNEYSNDVNQIITTRMLYQWIHINNICDINIFNKSVNTCYVNYIYKDREFIRPIFSAFTTCFNSYNKIIRAYESMKKQTLKDWEWVIIDDSPNEDNDKHFTFLRDLFKNDAKIRLYRKAFHSGNIGNVKNEAVSLCRGKYLLELDHDDEIVENLFENATRAFTEDDEIGFVYTDFINIYENGSNFHYGDFFGKGYAGYYRQKYNGKWVYVCITPNINNVTMSHLVGMPNHPRIWKRSVLMNILGNYNEYLYICDDLELLLKKTRYFSFYGSSITIYNVYFIKFF
jgi:hypothetical protein